MLTPIGLDALIRESLPCSTTGYYYYDAFLLNGAFISLRSKRQNVVALTSAEAEFMAASSLV